MAARKKKYTPKDKPLYAAVGLPQSDWRPVPVSDLPDWRDCKRVCVDTETRDDFLLTLGPGVRRGGYICGYSFAIEGGPAHYVPIRHEGGDNVDEVQALRYMRDMAAGFKGTLVGANLGYDLDYLAEENVNFNSVESMRDVLVAEPLIDELQMQYSLDAVAARHGIEGKDETLLRAAALAYNIDPKGDMWRMAARYVGAYGIQDTVLPLEVLRIQERIMERVGLQKIFDLESRVTPALVRMRRRGILIDQPQLERIEEYSLREEAAALDEVHRLTGVRIDVGDVMKARCCGPALRAVGVALPLTGKTLKDQVDQAILAGCGHPAGLMIMRARKVSKLRTTFATSIRKHMTNGRIHGNLNQLARDADGAGGIKGARWGRMSGSQPNMQQQPSRDEFASMWKKIYLPEHGSVFGSDDYSQQEPRWLTHYAEITRDDWGKPLRGAHAAAQAYRDNPNLDNHQLIADMCGIERDHAKTIYLGKIYGMGGGLLCEKLELPWEWKEIYGRQCRVAGADGQVLLEKFDDRAPFIKQMAKKAERAAAQRGYIITAGGRHCHFPKNSKGKYDWCNKALNRLIQGSAADQTKEAVVACDEAGYFLQLQVHDELCGSFESGQQARDMAYVMENVVPMTVPSVVTVKVGPSWGEIKKWQDYSPPS